jgi:hypothetical protein
MLEYIQNFRVTSTDQTFEPVKKQKEKEKYIYYCYSELKTGIREP